MDLGGPNPSASTLACVLPARGNAAVVRAASRAIGGGVGPKTCALMFVSQRFVLPPDRGDPAHLSIGYADAVVVFHMTDSGGEYVRLDRNGAHVARRRVAIPSRRPGWMVRSDERLAARDTLPPAAPGFVTGFDSPTKFRQVPVRPVGTAKLNEYGVFNGIRGVMVHTVQVDQSAHLVFRYARSLAGDGAVVSQALAPQRDDREAEVWISRPLPAGPPEPSRAPQGMYYGDPLWGCGGRSNPDNCLECCDTKESTAVTMGMGIGSATGAAAIGAGAYAGALTGVWAGPVGAGVGALVGCLIGVFVALLASNECNASCHDLFPRSPSTGSSKYQLTAVVRGNKGQVLGYLGEDEQGLEWALTREDGVAAVSGGLDVVVRDEQGNEGSVVVAERDGSEYLKTYPNSRLADNILEQLVVYGELPGKTGLELG
ncbi:DUF3892 domain-containing protein [Kribbella sp. NPDC049227]|uniref:DUF3892 domain-containing protein n=1 Tax=Kribbella sp. NPDC049227 TaxID=3364113 RepID=UPI0037100432